MQKTRSSSLEKYFRKSDSRFRYTETFVRGSRKFICFINEAKNSALLFGKPKSRTRSFNTGCETSTGTDFLVSREESDCYRYYRSQTHIRQLLSFRYVQLRSYARDQFLSCLCCIKLEPLLMSRFYKRCCVCF